MKSDAERSSDIAVELGLLFAALPTIRAQFAQATLTTRRHECVGLVTLATLGAAIDLVDDVRALWLRDLGCLLASDLSLNDPSIFTSIQTAFAQSTVPTDAALHEQVRLGFTVLGVAHSKIQSAPDVFESMDRQTQRQHAEGWLSVISRLVQSGKIEESSIANHLEVLSLEPRVLERMPPLELFENLKVQFQGPSTAGSCSPASRRQYVKGATWNFAAVAEQLVFDRGVSPRSVVRAAFDAAGIGISLGRLPLTQWVQGALDERLDLSLEAREMLGLLQLFLRPILHIQAEETKGQFPTALRSFELYVNELATVWKRPELLALWRTECEERFAILERTAASQSTQ